jgi:hypothetical protein
MANQSYHGPLLKHQFSKKAGLPQNLKLLLGHRFVILEMTDDVSTWRIESGRLNSPSFGASPASVPQ